jgi:hypothetical protein
VNELFTAFGKIPVAGPGHSLPDKTLKVSPDVSLMEYRCTDTADKWHFCRNCSRWPQTDFNVLSSTLSLPDPDVCEECTAVHDRGECQTCSPRLVASDELSMPRDPTKT